MTLARILIVLSCLALHGLPAQAQEDVRARIAAMPAGTPGHTDLFVLSLAGDGRQWVFSREARTAIRRFDARYGSGARSLLLSNQPELDPATPIASRLTVGTAITAFAAQMNREEDILLLFLTSHGGNDGTIALSNGFDDLPPLSATDVDGWLRSAGIRRSIIVISACYSGTWARALNNPHRIVLMAARADRTSFGCSDDRELTFFGEALFSAAMAQGLPLLPAFDHARSVIAVWEKQGGLLASEPQKSLGRQLLPVWTRLEAAAPAAPAVHVARSAPAAPPRLCLARTC